MKYLKFILVLILVISCSKDEDIRDYTVENDQEIQAYIAANNLVTQESISGLNYIIDNPGTGINPTVTDRIKVVYKGYFTDGTIFDKSTEEGVSINFLGSLISGFAEGLTYFKEGGSGKLIMPSRLAYGSKTNGNIPAGSVIIFDIELIYVNYKTENEQEIQAYLLANDITAQKSESGLYYAIDELGEGLQPTLADNVTVTYKGYLTGGEVFDDRVTSVNFDLDGLIPGFAEGITYFKEGGFGKLFIPAHLAYGNTGVSIIPGGDVIIFDIKLISVN
tara:strand:- start:16301 stop:17131 length:831 start_codon:yes stop_codon:yes gene_type:complete